MWPFNLPLFDALCWWIMDEPGKESWGIHRGATDIESLPSSSSWKLLVKVSEDASGARYETSGRVWNSVFVFQTLPKTLKIPQADLSRSVRLKPETQMEFDKHGVWSAGGDGGCRFLPLAPWELNPRLCFSPLPVRDGSQNKNITLFLAARLRREGGGEKGVQRTYTHT